jgi:hypothetical protein
MARHMADKSEEAKARAEGQFRRREQLSRDAEQAKTENAARARAIDQNTARLKGLRLAKEAADREVKASAEPVKKPARKPKSGA